MVAVIDNGIMLGMGMGVSLLKWKATNRKWPQVFNIVNSNYCIHVYPCLIQRPSEYLMFRFIHAPHGI